ncbi:MAG TPA: tRNA glutamyl-Q(34) synthetase GluQRS [Gammaproteobacteria bacterium]|nr:tRNA glutamyl-Q(34) synthetase GluQRS [Gammaproteobacteria bacterium]
MVPVARPAPEPCRGRFAPSPTGPLHFGSLVAAMASYLEVRTRGGTWLVRMEDLDPPREVPGAADHILRTLAAFGMESDEPVLYQSRRLAAYEDSWQRLRETAGCFPCACSRATLRAAGSTLIGNEGPIYPGTCRRRPPPPGQPVAWRVPVPDVEISFTDAVQGPQRQNLAREVGDFVVRRRDGLFAYQLAVVVDDAFQGITHVVRGSDLLDSTPRQIYLQEQLGVAQPAWLHTPVATLPEGEKLSKQTGAQAVVANSASLHAALCFLGQPVPMELARAPLAELWDWALTHWQVTRIPRQLARPAPA